MTPPQTSSIDELRYALLVARLEERELEDEYRALGERCAPIHLRMREIELIFHTKARARTEARAALLAAQLDITIEEAAQL